MLDLTLLSNETLRLQPPVPVGVLRGPLGGSGGAVVAEKYETCAYMQMRYNSRILTQIRS